MRLKQIDFLRGIAVIMVLFRHHYFLGILKQVGWAGVDLFFVLSGFLVSGLLFSEFKKFGNIKGFLFLIRRGFKIYPLFYFLIAGTIVRVLYEKFLGSGLWTEDPMKILGELIFLQNYIGSLWVHTWSLAVEEHFYFSLTILVFFFVKWKILTHKQFFTSFVLVICLACITLRIINNFNHPYTHYTHLFPTHFRYDSLLFGVFMAYQYHFNKENLTAFFSKYKIKLYVLASLFISTLFFYPEETFFMNTIGLSFLYVGFGIILIQFVITPNINENISKIISKPLYNWIGIVGYYSYSIYLFHLLAKNFIADWLVKKLPFELHFRIEFVLYFFTSIFLGILVSKIIEIPFLKLRDKYFPRRAKAI